LFDHFSFLSPIYDRLIRPKDPTSMLDLLELTREGKLLDAGGGTGRIGFSLQPYVSQVIVADISHGMLRQARQKNGLQPVCAPSESLPFQKNTFDRIIMVDALHHVENAAHTISEFWRVTKPGGKILIEEPDIRSAAVKIVAVFEKVALMRSHFISPAKIANLFHQFEVKPQIKKHGYTAWIIVDKPG
jgi:demethylmenaquinone methyltransferase/2-methoxy-6-polyprenyl-1,4-benzoquinol methylase